MPDILHQMWDYLSSDAAWSGNRGPPALTWAHIKLSVLAGSCRPPSPSRPRVARPLPAAGAGGVDREHRPRPTFAIIVLILPFSLRYGFGLGFWPTLVALVLLAVPPIFTNTYTAAGRAARCGRGGAGMGMRAGELVRKVEVPVAWPLIITGSGCRR